MVWMDPNFRYPTQAADEARAVAAAHLIPTPDTRGWRLTRRAWIATWVFGGVVLVGVAVVVLFALT